MENIHTRVYPASPEAIRPWLEAAWSGTDRDVFPRDLVPSWRDTETLVPGRTRLGHGPFRFKLQEWDGWRWRVAFPGGWHGFDLTLEGDGTRVTHTLRMGGVIRPILPLHDWAVEALLDRLGRALETGSVPSFTERPLEGYARMTWRTANLPSPWKGEPRVHNRHARYFPHPPEKLRPWVEQLWSGTDADCFPRDFLPTFRKGDLLGHGPARFLMQKWDGHNWEARIKSNRMTGRQGFVLTPEGPGTRITHVLELTSYPILEWACVIRPVHDWAVEAVFDRLETALETGAAPARTRRPLPPLVKFAFWLGKRWFKW